MAEREPKPYQPGLLIRGRHVLMMLIVVIGVLSHAALGVWAWDKPIALVQEFSPTKLNPIRVKRAAADEFDYRPAIVDEVAGPTAEELTKKLLESEPPELISGPLDLDVELRPLDELREGAKGDLNLDLPDFQLSEDVLTQLDTRPGELSFNEGAGNTGNGNGAGKGSADLAGEVLGTPGAAPLNTPPTTTLLDRTSLDGPAGLDEVLPEFGPSLATPAIDFVDLALGDTTQISVPDILDDDFTYRVTRYDPTDWRGNPVPRSEEQGYFRVDITAKRTLQKLATSPKDLIFIIDTSASVSQEWVEGVTRGVSESLISLNATDRFNIVLFNEKVSLLSDEGAIDATRENVLAARQFLSSAKSVGYTDVNAAMRGLLIRDADPKRVYDLVLISDGKSTRGVVNTRDLINLITRDNDLVASIYCVGVGNKQDRELLNFLAYRNKGYSVYAEDEKRASVTIQDLISRLRYPIIKDVRLDVAGIDSESVFPADLPNIHQGQTIQVYGRFTEPGPFTMRLTGRSAGKDIEFTFRRSLGEAEVGDKAVANEWAFWKLHDLYSLIIREGEREALLEQVKALRGKYGLKTLY